MALILPVESASGLLKLLGVRQYDRKPQTKGLFGSVLLLRKRAKLLTEQIEAYTEKFGGDTASLTEGQLQDRLHTFKNIKDLLSDYIRTLSKRPFIFFVVSYKKRLEAELEYIEEQIDNIEQSLDDTHINPAIEELMKKISRL